MEDKVNCKRENVGPERGPVSEHMCRHITPEEGEVVDVPEITERVFLG